LPRGWKRVRPKNVEYFIVFIAIALALTVPRGFQRILHPPYSSDLAPSDFYLFGALKRQLENNEFVAPEDLLRTMVQILGQIPRKELMDVFNALVERVRWVVANNGSYFK
jgi:hypothetical protein